MTLHLARIAGMVGTAVSGVRTYKALTDRGYGTTRAAFMVGMGYDPAPDADNSLEAVGGRLLGTYGPLALGETIHQVVGNGNGAFGTGMGLKYNKTALPKGINL